MRKLPLLMVIASVLAGLGIVQMTFLLGGNVYRAVQWSQERAQLTEDVDRLERDLRTLRAVREHATDPEYLQELARCQGFVGGRERVVVDQRATVARQGNCEPVQLP